jgi:peroxiredoxin
MAKLKINVQAPEFSLEDYHGSSVSLSDFEGSKHVVLIFNRGFM